MRYIAELERKVQTLQTEATTLAAQLSMLQVIYWALFYLKFLRIDMSLVVYTWVWKLIWLTIATQSQEWLTQIVNV